MLADAIAAEIYKLSRHWTALFWGFCAVPLANLLFNLALSTWLALHTSGVGLSLSISAGLGGKPALGPVILHAFTLSGSFFFQIFYLAGAAVLFAGEYRWETWRLLVPRNSRFNLLAAKFAVYGLATAASILALGAAAAIAALYDGLLAGVMPAGLASNFPLQAVILFLICWAQLLLMGGFVALLAVATRALTGPLLAAIFFSVVQNIGMTLVHPWEAPLRFFAYLPAMSVYVLQAWIQGQEIAPGVHADPAKLLPAALFVLAWITALAAAAAGLFQRQDLPRE